MLDDSDSDSSVSVHQLTINEHFAQAYAYKKEREELGRLQEKYGPDATLGGDDDSEDSESDETEDEDGEDLTPAMDAAILRTLARIRSKDPAIYETTQSVFEQEQARTKAAKPKAVRKAKEKPVTLKQQNISAILNPRSRSTSPRLPTHVEEQEALRSETISAFHKSVAADNHESDSDDGLLVLREKTTDENEREEEEYKVFLEREVGNVNELLWVEPKSETAINEATHEDSVGEGSKHQKKKRKATGAEKAKNEQSDQDFLINYIVNRGWIDKSARHLPTYSEITGSKGKPHTGVGGGGDDEGAGSEQGEEGEQPALLEDDDEFEEVVDRFESSYNHRFEEPDAATISRHPRNLTSTVRRADTSRKEARERREARKAEEIAKRKEEVNRLQALKMREIRKKLDIVEKEGDWKNAEALEGLELEADWDPEQHDRKMAELYGEEDFYAEADDEKPVWDDDIDITDIVPEETPEAGPSKKKSKKQKKKERKKLEKAAEEAGVDMDAMDADVEVPILEDDEEWDGTEEMRQRKLKEYMDQVYGLEFNDIVAGQPTRFKYTQTAPTSYSLTPAEILLATDKELNEYVGMKKYAPYRKGKDTWDSSRGNRLSELKEKLAQRSWAGEQLNSAGGIGENGTGEKRKGKKRKGRKERERQKGAGGVADQETQSAQMDVDVPEGSETTPKRKRRKKSHAS